MMVIFLALRSALGLLLIWLFVCFIWKDYCLDAFREEIFAVRDALFLYAADGNIEFQNPAYTMLRNKLNVILRYAREFTLARFVLAILFLSKVHDSEAAAWEQALASLPPDVQESLVRYRNAFVLAFVRYVTLRSFFLYSVFLLAQVLGVFKGAAKRYMLPKLVVGVERLESEASEEESRDRRGALPVGAA
jgi:hypothetical protein